MFCPIGAPSIHQIQTLSQCVTTSTFVLVFLEVVHGSRRIKYPVSADMHDFNLLVRNRAGAVSRFTPRNTD